MVVGNDQGGADTRPLVYAGVDAAKVYDILTRLGGVEASDAALVVGGGSGDVLAALAKVARQAAEAARRGERTALFFYYSGHAKDGALRLGDTRLPIDTLRATVATAPVDVRIVILDACRSGVVTGGGTRTKGARKAPAFAIESESPRDAKGMVILTSSSSDEDSQESDAIGGSYFSHHLASGLLGGADRSGDGRVTLFEAYAYAYDRTVADTADSLAGAQHPTFSYDLAGNGDLVLTDVATRHEGIYIPRQAPGGVYYLVDRQGFVAAEIDKGDGADRRVALAPGRYRVKRRLSDRLRVGEIDVARGELVTLEENNLHDAPFSADPVKGARADLTSRWSMGAGLGLQAVFAAPDGASLFPPTALIDVDVALRDFLRRDWVLGFDLAGGSANARRGAAGGERAVSFHGGVDGRIAVGRMAAPLVHAVRGRTAGAAGDEPPLRRATSFPSSSSRRFRPACWAAWPFACRGRPASSRAAACITFCTTSTATAPWDTGSSRQRWHMTSRTLTLALVACALGAGCGNYSNEDLEYMAAVPTSTELAVELPAAVNTVVEAELAKKTHEAMRTVNDSLVNVLALVDAVRGTSPTSRGVRQSHLGTLRRRQAPRVAVGAGRDPRPDGGGLQRIGC